MPRRERPTRAGFTLLEVMVALLLSAMELLVARMLLEQLSDNAVRTVDAAARADNDANGERLLRDLAGRLEVGTDGATQFSGEANTARFGAWCNMPSGWLERCVVSLVVREYHGQWKLLVTFAAQDSMALLTRSSSMELRYLDDPRAGGSWFRSWDAGITAPLAFAVIAGAETTIVRIGERG